MMAVDCYGLDLVAVPQNLRTDTEVCLSWNLCGCRVFRYGSFQARRFLTELSKLTTSPCLCNKIIEFLSSAKHNLCVLRVMAQPLTLMKGCKLQVLRHRVLVKTGK
jgi:hypothetical protein